MPLSSKKHVPYMREHSTLIRCMTPNSHLTVEEDAVIPNLSTMSRSILVVTCRNKQRQLQYAWQRWLYATDVRHDYKKDVITILSRSIPEDELRTELEIEVIFKWVLQTHHVDPTGLAYTIFMCRSKSAIIRCIQQCRLEKYPAKCPILLQNDLPRSEEGHFTVLSGQADILIFPPDSMQLLQLHSSRKNGRGDEEIQKILDQAIFIDTVKEGSGFGELSTITKMKRSATVRSWAQSAVELLVIPNFSLLGLLEHRRALMKCDEGNVPASAEVMDYLRQSGLVYKAAMVDVMEAASCMVKTHYQRGSILFKKGDQVDRLFIVLYGEILLDTKDYEVGMSKDNQPFQDLEHDRCHLLKSGSIIGDEGMVGNHSTFESSAIVVSETATFFEVWGFGIAFLASRLGVEKYSALVYKDQSMETGRLPSLNDDLILHSTFNSLRKSIAAHNPYRGKTLKANRVPLIIRDILVQEKEQEHLDVARLTGTASLLPSTARPISSPSRPSSPSGRKSPGKRPLGTAGGLQSAFRSPSRSMGASLSPTKSKSMGRLPSMAGTALGSPEKKDPRHSVNNRANSGRPRSRGGAPKSNLVQPHHGPTLKHAHILSAAAMHHVQAVLKMVKKRDVQQMRIIAQVWKYII
jgi:CRP-like cAMP-binding protein